MNSTVKFGAGSDIVQLAGTSQLNGDIDFGGGAGTLTLAGTAAYVGALTGTAGMAITLGDGTSLTSANLGTVDVGSLTVGNNATLGVTIDSSTGTSLRW